MKQEMIEHQHIISSHHKEMQELRDAVKYSVEKLASLYEHTQKEIREKTDALNEKLERVHAKLQEAEKELEERKKINIYLLQEMQDMRTTYVRQFSMQSFIQQTDHRINECNAHHMITFQQYQQETKSLISSIMEEVATINEQGTKRNAEVDAKIESKFSVCQLDKEGVFREVRLYKKSMFIIEKKIEHLYLLIEKIRGEACHKPV